MEVEEISENKIATNDKAPERLIKESTTEIIAGGAVFYNPVQEFNRDLSISVLNVYSKRLIREREAAAHKNPQNTKERNNANDKKPYTAGGVKYDDGLRILEALAATGLRSISYAKEVAGVREIVANDLSKVAVDSISVNMRHNGVEHLIVPSEGDAIKATTPAKEPVSCQRFSLDVEDVDQHESNVAVSGNAMNKLFEMEDENKSNHANTIKRIPYNFSTKASCDETIFECQQQRTSDESFMALEKMCDKTASDPNSTLFKYIHSENKDMVKEDAKKRSADGNYFKIPCKQELQEIDEEAQSLQRLLHDLCVQEQHQLDNETPLKSIDVTLLEDIEAPSKMWDSTIVGDTTLQTSPLKMVKLLRPSTILEENCEDQSNSSLGGDDASSHISFQSAQKGSETSATTSFKKKGFTYTLNLRRHIRTHTGGKPYKCEYCECTFAVSDPVLSHLLTYTSGQKYS
ncbi:uncharacterized protein [Eurosta solidaginis]|uniref:uncharacterized protein isoform X1 n=1 Tax=Eurosta solidaginis TaxID=178769 RepID=UPI0035307256